MKRDVHDNDNDNDENEGFENSDKLPTPAKPSLRMRLFRNEAKRDALRSLLDGNNSGGGSGGSGGGGGGAKNVNVWLSKNSDTSTTFASERVGESNGPCVISLDDSW